MKIKNKKLPIILGTCGVLAVGTVGFATWLIGYENKESSNDVQVTIDTFTDKGCILECIPTAGDGKINLGDYVTSEPDTSKKPIKVEIETIDLTVGLDSFKLAVSNSNQTKPTKVKFEVKVEEVLLSSVTHNVKASDPFKRTAGDKTFLDFCHTAEIQLSSIDTPDTTTIEGWTIYDFKAKSEFAQGFKFQYGSLYKKDGESTSGNVSPATFYNTNTPDYDTNQTIESQKDTLAKWSLASEELDALSTAFHKKTINIKVTVE